MTKSRMSRAVSCDGPFVQRPPVGGSQLLGAAADVGGAAYVFERSAPQTWSAGVRIGSLIPTSEYGAFGAAVAIDGSTTATAGEPVEYTLTVEGTFDTEAVPSPEVDGIEVRQGGEDLVHGLTADCQVSGDFFVRVGLAHLQRAAALGQPPPHLPPPSVGFQTPLWALVSFLRQASGQGQFLVSS